MTDNVHIGKLPCSFMSEDEFVSLCASWIDGEFLMHVVTLNPEMVLEAERNERFRKAAKQADIRVPDGVGIVWARWYLRSRFWSLWPSLLAFVRQPVERVTGVDTVMRLAALCEERGETLFLVGGRSEDVTVTIKKLQEQFPKLMLMTAPDQDALTEISRVQPAVLLVAYGAPKQTLWIEDNRAALQGVKIAVGVGGAFAILGERLPRAPKLLRTFNLEWLWRLYLEPRRAPRIWNAVVTFPLLIRKYKLYTRRTG